MLQNTCSVCKISLQNSKNNENINILTCTYCKEQKYCSRKCAKNDWENEHSKICKKKYEEKLSSYEKICPFLWDGEFLSDSQISQYEENMKNIRRLDIFTDVKLKNGNSWILGKNNNFELKVVRNIENKRMYIMKCIRKNSENLIKKELEFQRKIIHKNIVRIFETFHDLNRIYVVNEFPIKGSLFQYIKNEGALPEYQAFNIFVQVCNAIQFLHTNLIMHRNIIPENIELFENFDAKITGFDCATHFLKDSEMYFFNPIYFKKDKAFVVL